MSNITTFGGSGTGLMSRDDLAKALNNTAQSLPSVGGDKQFLKMDKNNGEWVYGQDETVVEPDSLWAINPASFKHGWVAWDTNAGGAPVQELMVPINRPLPAVDSLPKLGMATPDRKGNTYQLEYQQQRSVDLVCISGEDEGVSVEYKQSSIGAMKLFGKLTNALLDQLNRAPDAIVAVGNLTFEAYTHKKYGKIHNPDFKIVEWRTMDDTSAPGGAEPAAPAAAPKVDTAAEEAALAAEYAATKAAESAQGDATPRRRLRRQ